MTENIKTHCGYDPFDDKVNYIMMGNYHNGFSFVCRKNGVEISMKRDNDVEDKYYFTFDQIAEYVRSHDGVLDELNSYPDRQHEYICSKIQTAYDSNDRAEYERLVKYYESEYGRYDVEGVAEVFGTN